MAWPVLECLQFFPLDTTVQPFVDDKEGILALQLRAFIGTWALSPGRREYESKVG